MKDCTRAQDAPARPQVRAQVSGCKCDQIHTVMEFFIGDLGVPLPVMTQPLPQTFVYEQVDLTACSGGVPERRPLLPAGYPEKGGISETGYHQDYPGVPRHPIMQQPVSPSAPPGRDEPPPPSYSECIQMSVLSGPGAPSAPPAGRPAGFPQAAAAPYHPPAEDQWKYS